MVMRCLASKRDADRRTSWQSQFIRPVRDEFTHCIRATPSRTKAHTVLICNESCREMKCIAVPVDLVAYAGNLMRASGASPRTNWGHYSPLRAAHQWRIAWRDNAEWLLIKTGRSPRKHYLCSYNFCSILISQQIRPSASIATALSSQAAPESPQQQPNSPGCSSLTLMRSAQPSKRGYAVALVH